MGSFEKSGKNHKTKIRRGFEMFLAAAEAAEAAQRNKAVHCRLFRTVLPV